MTEVPCAKLPEMMEVPRAKFLSNEIPCATSFESMTIPCAIPFVAEELPCDSLAVNSKVSCAESCEITEGGVEKVSSKTKNFNQSAGRKRIKRKAAKEKTKKAAESCERESEYPVEDRVC